MAFSRTLRLVTLTVALGGASSWAVADPTLSGTAPADPASDEAKRADAKSRYEQGVEAYKKDRFKDAIDLFLEADRLAPSAPLSFNIARSYEKIGDDAGALRWYRDYLRRDPNAKNAADVHKVVRGLESSLAKKGVQQITVLSTPAGGTVTVDGHPVGVTPFTGEFAPGKHEVDVSLRGYADSQQSVALSADEARDLIVRLVPDSGAASVPPPPGAAPASTSAAPPVSTATSLSIDSGVSPERTGPRFGVLPWIGLGVGVAALGGALTFELSRRRAEDQAKNDQTQVGYQDKLDTMHSRQTTARILAGVGGAFVVAGGVLLALDLSSPRSKERVAFSLSCAPQSCGLIASGRFR
jgi:tetratricopeptide (TPR) repeat protein